LHAIFKQPNKSIQTRYHLNDILFKYNGYCFISYSFANGSEDIPTAINSVQSEQFVQSRGDRPTVENVLVLITDAYQTGADTAITVCFSFIILYFILHIINSSNERPLFVPRDRPIFYRIGSKKIRFFAHLSTKCSC